MYLSYHGGGCCGVKHIWGFYHNPKTIISAIGKLPSPGQAAWYQKKSFFFEPVPAETGIERLDRYLKHMEKTQPGALIEIFLAEYKHDKGICQISHGWPEVLLERGFVASEPFVNSNTNNLITRYTLVTTKDKSKAKAQAPLRMAPPSGGTHHGDDRCPNRTRNATASSTSSKCFGAANGVISSTPSSRI